MLMTIYEKLICCIISWIINKPSFTDWLMVIVTGIYTFETIKICKANLNSANASRAQLEESKRQYEETKRLQIMPYFRVDFEKWIPTHQKDEIIPYHPLYLSTPVQKEDEITGSCSIKVTNIGMGMAIDSICKPCEKDITYIIHLPKILRNCNDAYVWDFLIISDKNNINTESIRSLRFEFDDFYGNHYYQDLSIVFFVDKNTIRVNSYEMQAPKNFDKQEEAQNV